jgi:periplasmic protein TonB
MEANKILTANVLDILFENRNKDYGAYELRRHYNKRMSGSLLIIFIIIFISFIFYSFSNTSSTKTVTNKDRDSVKITIVNLEPEMPILSKPQPAIQIKSAIYTAPLILKDETVRNQDLPPELETLRESKIDLVNQSGINDIGIAPLTDNKSIFIYPKNEIIDNNEAFTAVEVEASFKGGGEAWRKWVLRNLNPRVPINNGATPGVYTIIIQFIVDTEGNISEVTSLTNHGYGMEEEAMRVIRNGPNWEPAIQNGRKVKAYRKQPITFVVTQE